MIILDDRELSGLGDITVLKQQADIYKTIT